MISKKMTLKTLRELLYDATLDYSKPAEVRQRNVLALSTAIGMIDEIDKDKEVQNVLL